MILSMPALINGLGDRYALSTEMKNITKTFGSVKAIDNVSLRLNAGEIVSLCGEMGQVNQR